MEESEFGLYAAHSRHIWKHAKDQCSDALHLTRIIPCTAFDPYSCRGEYDINPQARNLREGVHSGLRVLEKSKRLQPPAQPETAG